MDSKAIDASAVHFSWADSALAPSFRIRALNGATFIAHLDADQ